MAPPADRPHNGPVQPSLAIVPLSLALALACPACAGQAAADGPGYRYRQAMIDPEAAPLPEPAPTPRTRPAPRGPTRCRALVGRLLPGSRPAATARLLSTCLGERWREGDSLPAASRERPQLLDLALFTATRPGATGEVGVVVAVSDSRVEFVHLRGESARVALGVLDLRHPARRRAGDGRVVNTYLRVIQQSDPPGARYLAGELLLGFAPRP